MKQNNNPAADPAPALYTPRPSKSILTDDPFTKFRLKFEFRDKCFGGYPKSKELIGPWIKSRTGHEDELTAKQVSEAEEAMAESEMTDSVWTGFPGENIPPGVYLDNRAIKSGLRECFSVARIFTKRLGSKQIFQHAMVVDGLEHQDRIYLKRDGKHLLKADNYIERPIHPDTAQGKRSALKRADYVEQAQVEFVLRIYATDSQEKRHIGRKELEAALVLFQEDGLGADRSQSFGRFDVIELQELTVPE